MTSRPGDAARESEESEQSPPSARRRSLTLLNDPRAAHLRGATAADDPITSRDWRPEFGVSREARAPYEVRAFREGAEGGCEPNRAMETARPAALQAH